MCGSPGGVSGGDADDGEVTANWWTLPLGLPNPLCRILDEEQPGAEDIWAAAGREKIGFIFAIYGESGGFEGEITLGIDKWGKLDGRGIVFGYLSPIIEILQRKIQNVNKAV